MKKIYAISMVVLTMLLLAVNVNAQTYFSEDFSTWTASSTNGWTLIDANNDGRNWYVSTAAGHGNVARSDSWNNVPITPNNYMITPEITIPEDVDNAFVTWKAFAHSGSWPAENYSVYLVYGNTLDDITEDDLIFNETLTNANLAATPSMPIIDILDFVEDGAFRLAFRHHDCNDEWSLYINDVIVYTVPDLGLEINSIHMPSYVGLNASEVSGTVNFTNIGLAEISSVKLLIETENYSEEFTIETDLELNEQGTFDFDFEHAFTTGDKILSVEVIEINGENFESEAFENEFLVGNVAYFKKPLLENFSSATCPPCAPANANLYTPVYNNLGVNLPSSDVNVVKFQVPIPTAGDPSVNPHSNARRTFYGINAAPSFVSNGMLWSPTQGVTTWGQAVSVLNARIDGYLTFQDGKVDVSGSFYLNEDNELSVNVEVTPGFNLPTGYRLYISVNNKEYNFNGSNGETQFKNVNRRMLPNANGVVIPATTFGNSFEYSATQSFVVGSVAGGNHNLWNTDVEVIAWVQAPTGNRELLNSQSLTLTVPVGVTELKSVNRLRMFPNPTNSGEAMLNFNLVDAKQVSIEVFNLTGQRVGVSNLGNVAAGEVFHTVDITNEPAGIYLVRIIAGNETTTLRLAKN